jgi:hypothetical protein
METVQAGVRISCAYLEEQRKLLTFAAYGENYRRNKYE